MTSEESWSSSNDAQARLDRERAFHDERFAHTTRGASKYYAIAGATFADYCRRLWEIAPGSDVLEYGCGTGGLVFDMARAGHRATAIDLSPVAVETARTEAAGRGITGARFDVMNAEALELEDDCMDLVFGSGILHHLDLDRSLTEIARVLRPSGRAVFMEPLGKNVLINLYRRVTPGMRTPDEHPLLEADIDHFHKRFRSVDLAFFQLSTLIVAPFAGHQRALKAADRLSVLDQRLFRRFPGLRWQAWNVVIDLRSPHAVATEPSSI